MKYRGRISVSFEALKEMLGLDESIEITYVGMTDEDIMKDTCYINLSSKQLTNLTQPCKEASKFSTTLEIKELAKRS